MKLKPSPIKLNDDTDDSNPHRLRRLTVAVGNRRRLWCLSVGDAWASPLAIDANCDAWASPLAIDADRDA